MRNVAIQAVAREILWLDGLVEDPQFCPLVFRVHEDDAAVRTRDVVA